MGIFLDIVVVLVLLASVIVSVLRGFIREVLTILGLVGGAVAAFVAGPLLQPTTRGWFGVVEGAEDPGSLFGMLPYSLIADGLAYAIVFLVFVIIFSTLSHFLSKSVKHMGLGAVDRALGAVFGIARGGLILGLLYLFPLFLVGEDQQKEVFKESKAQPYLEFTSRWILSYVPKNAEEEIAEGAEKLQNMSETRKKFEEMDILEKAPDADGSDLPKSGYGDEFRERMDKLFEDVEQAPLNGESVLTPEPEPEQQPSENP